MRNVVKRLTKENDIEFLGWHVAEKIRADKFVLVTTPRLIGSCDTLGDRRVGNINAYIRSVSVTRKFIGRVTRPAAKIENISAARVLLKMGIDTIICGVVNEVPLAARKLFVPKGLLYFHRPVA